MNKRPDRGGSDAARTTLADRAILSTVLGLMASSISMIIMVGVVMAWEAGIVLLAGGICAAWAAAGATSWLVAEGIGIACDTPRPRWSPTLVGAIATIAVWTIGFNSTGRRPRPSCRQVSRCSWRPRIVRGHVSRNPTHDLYERRWEILVMSDSIDQRMLQLLRDKLFSCGVPDVADVAMESGQNLMMFKRRLAVTTMVKDEGPGQVHAHVISWLPNRAAPDGKDRLDACVMASGATTGAGMQQAADVWLHLVGAPVLSCLAARPLLDADHFDGHEEWGIPGGHGFVGPVLVRGAKSGDIDLSALAGSPAFQCAGYPADGRSHLAKVTLLGRDGRWERHIEIDGHTETHRDEDWRGLPPPTSALICTRFAVFAIA
jgi:hypothetical protein